MRLKITESQYNKIFLDESRGVPNDAVEIANNVVDSLVNEIDDIESEIEELKSSYGEEWDYHFSYDFFVPSDRDYHIELYYDLNDRKKASTDGYCSIEINYAHIKRIVDRAVSRLKDAKKRISQDTKIGGFVSDYVSREVRGYLYPIILHELTHDEDESDGPNDHIWLGRYDSWHEEDLRDILYIFSEKEMNARVSSSYAIMEYSMEELFVDKFENGREFESFVKEYVIDDSEDELQCKHMQTLVDLILLDFADNKDYIKQFGKSLPYSLSYQLYLNDSRLKNNRNLKRLFNQNYKAAKKFVADFYQGKLDDFKKRIMRTCYYAYQKHLEEQETISESIVNEFHVDGYKCYDTLSDIIGKGYLIHGTPNDFESFDEGKIKGGCRGEYGYGAYFTDAAYKALEYGLEIYMTKKDIYNFLNLDQEPNVSVISKLIDVIDEINMAQYKLEYVTNNREYDYYNSIIDSLRESKPSDMEEFILSMFRKAIESGEFHSLEQCYKHVIGNIPSRLVKTLSTTLMKCGYDGVKCGNQYCIYNIKKLNDNLKKEFIDGE